MVSTNPLKLMAQDAQDIAPVSAALQDAIGALGDFVYEAKARRFTLALNRFRWEQGRKGPQERVRTALQAASVISAKAHRLKQGAPDAIVSLLSITFEPGDDPSGTLVLTFSGGGTLRLEVECIDLVMADVSEPWRAVARPEHTQTPEADG